MKRWLGAAATAVALLGLTATASADGRWHGGYRGDHQRDFRGDWHGGYRGHWRGDDDDWHGHFYLGLGPGWGPWNPYWYPPANPYYYSPAPVIVTPPTTYIQQEAPKQEHYWYYCTDPKGYYPYVKQCPPGWMKVVPRAPSQ